MTAEQFLSKQLSNEPAHIKGEFVGLSEDADNAIFKACIEFAKLHVKAALSMASEKVKLDVFPYDQEQWENVDLPIIVKDLTEDMEDGEININKDSILNAYPENLIK